MTTGLQNKNKVISGMRKSCDVVIHIDVELALKGTICRT